MTVQIVIEGRRLEVERIPADRTGAPELVFLHEGLGSVSLWRDFPARVARATGCPATVYSRYGCGGSDLLREARPVRYMHDEARALEELLTELRIENPILVGHSDGGSIAVIHAGTYGRVRGMVLLAPHVFVEDISVASIADAKIRFETTDLPQGLARHHRDAASTFWGWNNIWLDAEFRRWNIEEHLPKITCPMLVIQGLDDEYGTMAQVRAIERQAGGAVEVMEVAECGHSPHRDQMEAVLGGIARFVGGIVGNKLEGGGV